MDFINKDYICVYKDMKEKKDFLFSSKVNRTSNFLDASVKPIADKKILKLRLNSTNKKRKIFLCCFSDGRSTSKVFVPM